jgi:hypothetical protein
MTFFPGKTNPELVIDPNGMLPVSVTFERVQLVPRRNLEIGELRCGFNHLQFPLGHGAKIRGRNFGASARFPKGFCFFVSE